jgi:hypothetical protein
VLTQEEEWTMVATARAKGVLEELGNSPGTLLADTAEHYGRLDRSAAATRRTVPRLRTPPLDPVRNPGVELAASLIALLVTLESVVDPRGGDWASLRRRLVAMAVRAVDSGQLGRFMPVEDAQAAWDFLRQAVCGMIETGFAGMAGDAPMLEELRLQCWEAAAAAIMVLVLTAEPSPSRCERRDG